MRRYRKLKPWVSNLIVMLSVILVTTIIGLVFTWIFDWNFVILETSYMLVGIITMLIALFNSRSREKKHYKETKSVLEDKTTKEYKKFRVSQLYFWGFGILNVILSLLVFMIINK